MGALRFLALPLTLASTLVALACQTTPPDPDGQPGGAKLLPMGALHADRLHCRQGDCADWFRFQAQERGDLVLHIESPVAAVGDGRKLNVILADGRGRQLAQETVSPVEGEALLTWQAAPGYYMARVEARDEARTPLPYELSLRLVLPPPPPRSAPPPPEPKFTTLTGEVLEIEGGLANPAAVLVDRGQKDGVSPGQTGRLLNGGVTIGNVVVVDTYPDGSRAKIDGSLSEPISPSTRVEINVPTEGE